MPDFDEKPFILALEDRKNAKKACFELLNWVINDVFSMKHEIQNRGYKNEQNSKFTPVLPCFAGVFQTFLGFQLVN